ncbi:MAG TPA: leucine--tRNA ligase [Candidatus Methylomirabilis sp.]|nr:leucine--tRNA ligase [Candidatus Methylomirabilis sp.]
MTPYDFLTIEARWQAHWQEHRTFRAANPGDPGFDPAQPRYYVLDMFPYPSGAGLHVGHPLGYIGTDIIARYKRMRGLNVLHPMGFDAFGLPAEQFAVEHGVHPRITTEANIATMVRQLKRLGLSYDWDRCLATTDVGYYKWTQWIFLQLYNSYFDAEERRARPIDDLIQKLESGELAVGFGNVMVPVAGSGAMSVLGGAPGGTRHWYELGPAEQEQVLAEHRLAYLAEVVVNWCPALGTVLANEEVTSDGRSDRGNHPVYKRPLRQWMLRITAYADRLADELDLVDWPEPIKLMQRNWIGRSEGARVDFPIDGMDEAISVFTTRPDTLFGATYMVLSPEHPLVESIVTAEYLRPVTQYREEAQSRSDVARMAQAKTGVFTGAHAVNPVNGERIPIWIADYVLMAYGTGAIMAVPAHDQRDLDFALSVGLPVRAVVMPDDQWLARHAQPAADSPAGAPASVPVETLRQRYREAPGTFAEGFVGDGVAINSAGPDVSLDDLATPEAKQRITEWLESSGRGERQVQYKLRDWLFSRQRYWGEPFPILHGPDGQIRPVDEADLPVELPEMQDFRPAVSDDPDAPPRPPLGRAPDAWRFVELDGVRWERELNTMPQWAGSCWYYLRFLDPENGARFVGREAEQYWMHPLDRPSHARPVPGVDLYVGGVEHAVLHLLYARFWHKVLHDLGHVSGPEPFGRLFNQGYIQAHAYQDERGMYVEAGDVVERDGGYVYQGKPVTRVLGKMGKSLKNAVSPDEVCERYGCDTVRLYEMYMGPLDASKPWETRDIIGMHRFLQRVWRNFTGDTGDSSTLRVADDEPSTEQARVTNRAIKAVTEDMEQLKFNTAIAVLIDMNGEMMKWPAIPRRFAEAFLLMLAPFAPHAAEELWRTIGHTQSLARAPWPVWDEALTQDAQIEIPVQVMGKVRSRIRVPADADLAAIEAAALADAKIRAHVSGKTVARVVIAPGKMVNIVTS